MSGAAAALAPGLVRAASRANDYRSVRVAFIGTGPKGLDNLGDFLRVGVTPVAVCDVDERYLAEAGALAPDAPAYVDFREMLAKEADRIDAVVVSTPDHNHAACTIAAMRRGKAVYCEKPLTYDVAEARRVAEVARETKVATQMGNQGHASAGLRQQVDWLRAGAIGDVHEVHVWTDRPSWPQGAGRFERQDQASPPEGMHWDLWLGPRPARPYSVSRIADPQAGREAAAGTYHPGRWRGWLDFGSGALGDMAPHLMDAAVWALSLTGDCDVEVEAAGANDETFPTSSVVTWHFPARPGARAGRDAELPPVTVKWYEGGRRPSKPADATDDEWATHGGHDGGAFYVGDRGTMFGPYTGRPTLSAKAAQGFTPPERQAWFLPESKGHHEEFLDAVRGGPAPASNFGYAAALTETVLLGTVAQRVGRRIAWDAAGMRVTNLPEANRFIRPERRRGWEL